jgi:hypothetical protein
VRCAVSKPAEIQLTIVSEVTKQYRAASPVDTASRGPEHFVAV